jgi:hypothetical protein
MAEGIKRRGTEIFKDLKISRFLADKIHSWSISSAIKFSNLQIWKSRNKKSALWEAL